MEQELKNIIKKVQKLYRLAGRAGTEEEAHSAMRMAKELISRYELSMADVESISDDDCGEEIIVIKKSYVPAHCRILMSAMKMLFQCRVIVHQNYGFQRNRQGLVFIGVGADAVLAKQTFEFLLEFARRKIRERKISDKSDYLYGFAVSILNRISDMRKSDDSQSSVLVPLKNGAIDSYVDKHYQNLKTMRSIRNREFSSDLAMGIDDGNTASLQRQVKGKGRLALEN